MVRVWIAFCLIFSFHMVQSASMPFPVRSSPYWPSSYAAMGDSYAAGVGAGSPIVLSCGRFSEAYPVQVAGSRHLNISHQNVNYLACGGSDSRSVLLHQVPFIGRSDVITITVGGNEVHFFAVMNACVYHWLPLATCEREIAEARALIQSESLIEKISAVISGSAKRMHPGALLLVTGYARFFNERTDLCDRITFSRTRPLDYLTKDKRKALNQLVRMLNDVVRASADLHGAEYIDIDAAFESHRFCEEGVHEPDIGREETWFFNLPAADFQAEKHVYELESGAAIDPKLANLQQRVGFGELAWRATKGEETRTGGTLSFPDLETSRTFHPTRLGHLGVAGVIVDKILKRKRLH